MFLKKYQIKTISQIKNFFTVVRTSKENVPAEYRGRIDWVEESFEKIYKDYNDKSKNGLGKYYPRVVLKIPTGGGKTLLAVETIREYQNILARRRTGLVVWVVPTETIYSQTLSRLRDKSNHLRQLLDQCSGGKTLILEKGQRVSIHDIEDNLVVLFVMIQSISRQNAKEGLKVFQDSGGYESFFPPDNRTDLHQHLIDRYPNLDCISEEAIPPIRTSLGNAIRVSSPLIIIDEIHKVFSSTAKKTIDNLNPEMVIGLSATPRADMNILVSITGNELKEEEMVKLDMHIIPPSTRRNKDWNGMLKEIIKKRNELEREAINFKRISNKYIRPIALIQVEATGKDQRGKGRVHSDDVKDFLVELGVRHEEIGIKTCAQNDIEDVDLLDPDCPIRYLITKDALREGWDCSFAYMLGIIPNINSNTGVTQLIGRILRQPFAKKTGRQLLDESYIYFSNGGAQPMIQHVEAGFQKEGLEDLLTKVKIDGRSGINDTKTIKIKKCFKKYSDTFYLPVWIVCEKTKRRFSYEVDISPKINFAEYKLGENELENIGRAFSDENINRRGYALTLNDNNRIVPNSETLAPIKADDNVNIEYLTRRFSEIIPNPFLARQVVQKNMEIVKARHGVSNLIKYFDLISCAMCNFLEEYGKHQEEMIFMEMIDTKKLILAVSKDDNGYKIPENDTITVSRIPPTYDSYLFDDVEIQSMNEHEKHVGDLLDKQSNILWWFRNKVNKKYYSIQGWRKGNIYPDFIATKKNERGKLELMYIIESKGEHLAGNENTIYKKSVFEKINKVYQPNLLGFDTEFYLIQENDEELKIRELFNDYGVKKCTPMKSKTAI